MRITRSAFWTDRVSGFALGVLLGVGAVQLVGGVIFQQASEALIPVAGLLGAAIPRARARTVFSTAAALLAVALLVVGYTPVLSILMQGLVRSDPLRKAPAVVVLSATLQKDGELSAASQARLLHGYQLLSQGYARELVLTKLMSPVRSYVPVVRRQMDQLGLAYPIEETGAVRNTRDEAKAVARLARRRGWSHVILVTHPWHMRRAAGVFEGAGVRVVCSPCTEGRYDLSFLDAPDARLCAFRDWTHEIVGCWIYRRRGWL